MILTEAKLYCLVYLSLFVKLSSFKSKILPDPRLICAEQSLLFLFSCIMQQILFQRVGKTLRFRLMFDEDQPYTTRIEMETVMYREPFETVTTTGYFIELIILMG